MRRGILAGIGAYLMWGLFPLYWKQLSDVPALEILAHRMTWSLVFMVLILAIGRDWAWLKPAIQDRRVLLIYLAAAALLSVNWFTYIWAVNAGFVVESSLGYFINPLVSTLFGVIFLKEHLRRGQLLAVALAFAGVLYLTVSYGSLPWIALVLSTTFATYGLIKKTAPLGSVHGFTLETIALFLPALGYLLLLASQGTGAFGNSDPQTTMLLALAGPVTSIPLLLFGLAARSIPLSMVGFLQYIAPTLQFLLGVLVYQEPFPPARLVGFSIIWAALAIYTLESILFNRRRVAQNLG
ncbi:MAG: EamA family transporter RarD [Anaerolineales bacterium]|jgi:chloramphenicol-sensitive protein RarD|nr:EamA family transporter RarD [Anaerolineales bacterium]